jgi:hypothetical protein
MIKKLFFFLAATLLLLTSCAETKVNPNEKQKSTEETEENLVETLTNIYPLSGIPTSDRTDKRAVAVMINNHPNARPQSGLSKADIVYELLAEGNVTRFLAVYQSETPEKVGPVRSARDYFLKLAKGFDPIYVYHGYSPDAKEMLDDGYIDSLNGLRYDGTLFERSKERKAPHNSYITFENIQKGAEQNSYDWTEKQEPFTFLLEADFQDIEGEPVTRATISYDSALFNATYEYDKIKDRYIRYTNGEQTVEYEDGTPIVLDNILIIEAPHKVIDHEGRRDIDLDAGGNAYLLQKGKGMEVDWVNRDGRIMIVKNGMEVGLVPGKTWVNVIPDHPGLIESVSFHAEGN